MLVYTAALNPQLRLGHSLEESKEYTVLREKISRCIYRVMTTDAMLTNTFWNFYIDPAE